MVLGLPRRPSAPRLVGLLVPFDLSQAAILSLAPLVRHFLEESRVDRPSSLSTYMASIAATSAIVGWLNANGSVGAPKTDDAIGQSMAALWPNLCEH